MAVVMLHPLVHAATDHGSQFDLPESPDQHSSSQHDDCLICVLAYSLSSEISESENRFSIDKNSNFYIWKTVFKLKSADFYFSLRAPPLNIFV